MTERHPWDDLRPAGKHIWNTLGYRRAQGEGGAFAVEWDAPEDFTFPAGERSVVHGGMVATLLDTAMGQVCALTLTPGEDFLTADLHVEFYRSARPGPLRAEAEVVHRGRRAVYCAASLYDSERKLLASARCTQIIRSSD